MNILKGKKPYNMFMAGASLVTYRRNSMTVNAVVCTLRSTIVPDELRMIFLPHYLGSHFVKGEALVYQWADRLSEDYEGGSWDFFQLSHGGFYLAPAHSGRLRVQWPDNYCDETMGPDAFGVVVTLYALNDPAFRTHDEKIVDHYHALRAFAAEHVEASKIFKAID
jgi:hypothetical protein